MSDSDRELRLASDFMDCIAALNGHGVTYVLVGAHEVGWHGFIRATGDIDFLYRQTESNVNRLCEALRDFGAPLSLIDPAFMMSHEPITQIGVQPLRIDFIATLSGVTFGEVDRGAIDTTINGQPNRDQPAAAQPAEVVLHGALGQSRQLSEVLERDFHNSHGNQFVLSTP